MSWFAVSYSSWSAVGPGICMDGSTHRVGGPFKKKRDAWVWACKHQDSKSMMTPFPYVFRADWAQLPKGMFWQLDDPGFDYDKKGDPIVKFSNKSRLPNKKARKGGYSYRRWHRCNDTW